MTRCPSCHAAVLPGETICLECGTELVLALSETLPLATNPPPDAAAPPPRTPGTACYDCGETVTADANGLCPVCGADLSSIGALDDTAFLDPTVSARSLAASSGGRATEVPLGPAAGPPDAEAPQAEGRWNERHEPPRSAASPAASPPLPADRARSRYRPSGATEPSSHAERLVLLVEGGQTVFFDGTMTDRIPFDVDELQIGRRDPATAHYPEIDLTHYRSIDGHISRRHARLLRVGDRILLEDLCSNDATWINDRSNVLNGAREEVQPGDRIIISDSIAIVLVVERGTSG